MTVVIGVRHTGQPAASSATLLAQDPHVGTELTQILVVVRRGTPHSSRLGLQRLLLLMVKSAPMMLPTGMQLGSLLAF